MSGSQTFTPTRKPAPLAGTSILGLNAKSDLQIVEYLSSGLSTGSVERLAEHLDLSLTRVLALTDIKSSTFHERKKKRQRLTPEESGRVYRLAKVTEAAEVYFGSQEQARRWLSHAKIALGGKTPLEFARTAEGADYVLKLIGRMAHGVIS